MLDISKWNKIIYRDANNAVAEGGLSGSDFFELFRIESWPTFENAAASHLPGKWVEDVSVLIRTAQKEIPDINFLQIKEKFCVLTIYYDSGDNLKFEKLKKVCIDRLIKKGVHPPNGD